MWREASLSQAGGVGAGLGNDLLWAQRSAQQWRPELKAAVLPICRVGDRWPAGMLTGKPGFRGTAKATRAAGAVRGCRGPTQDPVPLRVDLEGVPSRPGAPEGPWANQAAHVRQGGERGRWTVAGISVDWSWVGGLARRLRPPPRPRLAPLRAPCRQSAAAHGHVSSPFGKTLFWPVDKWKVLSVFVNTCVASSWEGAQIRPEIKHTLELRFLLSGGEILLPYL